MDQLIEPSDVVIIGGGVAGIMTAYYLHRQRISVTVIEKGRVSCEQSSRNWGWVRQQGRDSRELPIMIRSSQLWEGLENEIGVSFGWHRGGVTYIGETEKNMAEFEHWLEIARSFQLDTRMLSRSEILSMLGQPDGPFAGAITTPSDGRAEPRLAVPAVADYLRSNGVQIIENCAARLLDRQGGRICGVHTEKCLIRCHSVVVAAGAWSQLFLRRHGIRLPQLAVKASVMRTSELPLIHQSTFGHSKAAIRRRADGGYTVARSSYSTFEITADALRYLWDFKPVVKTRLHKTKIRLNSRFFDSFRNERPWSGDDETPFERTRILDPVPDHRLLDRTWKAARKIFPQLAGGRIVERWAGMIDVTPDEIPVIDEAEGYGGLFVLTGFSGHGFGIGPGAGFLMAEMVAGKTPYADPKAFSLARFSEPGGVRQGDAL